MKTPEENKVSKKDLAKYTKAELIEIIIRLTFHTDPFQYNGYLKNILIDIEYSRQMTRIDKAHEHAQQAFDARTEAGELLKPYEGKPFSSVPNKVLRKVDECMKRAQQEDAAWGKLQKEIDAYGKDT